MEKPTCLCGEEVTFLMDSKKYVIWQCKHGRLLLRAKYSDWQRWYLPEAWVKERG